jgi:hypothetical protein
MQVTVKGIEAKLGNNGVLHCIADNDGKHIGKLRFGQATVEWCPGRTRVGNGTKIPMEDFIKLLDQY